MYTLSYRSNSIGLLSADGEVVKRPPVRRNLFGTPTPEKQTEDFLTQENRFDEEAARQRFISRWGFDPLHGIPVENSKYGWSAVKSEEDTPSFYLKHYAHSKSRPVHSPRRERSSSAPYYRHHISHRPKKRGQPEDDEENTNINDMHTFQERVIEEGESLFNTPKSLRSSLPSDLPKSDSELSSSSTSSSNSSLMCSNVGCRSQNVSNNSIGLTYSSLRQQTLYDHFQVKKPRCLSKSLPRT